MSKIYGNTIQGMRATTADALIELGKKNNNVVVIDCETAVAANIFPFVKKFPERFIETAIAEQNAISIAFGLERSGFIPFVPIFACFIARRAFDQVFVHVGYPNANIKLIGCYVGISAASVGATHQAFNDIALMRTIPNMVVIETADTVELEQAIFTAADYKGPVYIRVIRSDLPKYEKPLMPKNYHFRIGKAVVLKDGTDLTLIGSGMMVARCLEAADLLKKEGISVEVINVSTIKPIDEQTIVSSAKKTGRVVTAENSTVIGSMGSAVAELLIRKQPVPMAFVGIQDRFGHSAVLEDLITNYNLSTGDILNAAKKVL
jgi:transketolase